MPCTSNYISVFRRCSRRCSRGSSRQSPLYTWGHEHTHGEEECGAMPMHEVGRGARRVFLAEPAAEPAIDIYNVQRRTSRPVAL